MSKKLFFFGVAALLSVSLFMLGCPTDADGSAGAAGSAGQNVGYINTTPVTDADLAPMFTQVDVITLGPTVVTISGTVPAGKRLVVSGVAVVANGKTLVVEGSVEVLEGAALKALNDGSTSGPIYGAPGSVKGKGVVVLPYGDQPDGVLTYLNAGGDVKKANGDLTQTSIAPFFAAHPNVTELTVYGITGLTAAEVPAGRTLILTGSTNTTAGALDLSAAGKLIVAEGAKLTTGGGGVAIKANGTESNIIINGTLALANAGDSVVDKVTNNGVISTVSVTEAAVKTLLTLEGSGTISSGGASLNLGSSSIALSQNLVITAGTVTAPAQVTPFSTTTNRKITIGSGGTLDLGATTTSVGVDVTNGGTITTAATTLAALQTIVNIGGKITSTGAMTFNGFTGTFSVPRKTTLTAAGTFAGDDFEIVIDGSATFDTGTFQAQKGKITVNGTATFTAGTFAALEGDLVINGEATFGADAKPLGNIAVNGLLTVVATKSLTVAAGKTLTVGNEGSIVLKGETGTGAKLVLASAAFAEGGAAEKGGGGKLELAGSTATAGTDLGTNGVIQVAEDGELADLTATRDSDNKQVKFGGSEANTGITNIVTDSYLGFKSIEAATVAAASTGTVGLVTFEAASDGNNDLIIDKGIKAKSTT
jgi:hypothetical protein